VVILHGQQQVGPPCFEPALRCGSQRGKGLRCVDLERHDVFVDDPAHEGAFSCHRHPYPPPWIPGRH
jgi:hypothetical protein